MTQQLRRRVAKFGAAATVVVLVVLAPASAAFAHATLVSTSPAQSAHFPAKAPPKSVVVVFDEAVVATPTTIGVYDGAGQAMKVRPVTGGSHKQVGAALPPLPEGTYVVVWHVVSDDGHPEHGAFTFSVGRGGVATTDIGSLLASQRSSRAIGLAFDVDRTLEFLATLVLVGGLVFVRWRWPAALERRESRRLLLGAAAVAALASLASVPLQAAYSTGGGASAFFHGSTLRGVLDARFGQAAIGRVVLLCVLGACVVSARSTAAKWARDAVDLVSALLGIATFATIAYAGHGYTGRWPTLAFATDIAHLSAAAAWLGGLVVLAAALRAPAWSKSLAQGAERFSQVALPAVGILVLSGVLQGWRQIGSWFALWHTSYARLLLLKVLVVVAIVVIASGGRDVLRDRRAAKGRSGDGSTVADSATLAELRHGVWLEAGLAVVVMVITSLLVVSPPGREAEAAAARPTASTVRLTAESGNLAYAVAVQPDLAGTNTIVVRPRLTQPSGFLPATLDGTVSRAGSARPVKVTFTAIEDGRWVTAVPLPTAGTWTVTLTGSAPPSSSTARLQVSVR